MKKKHRIIHIFERFYRADTSRTKNKIDGFGLGLSIAKNIADVHGAKVASAVRCQYGGSVKAGNIREFMAHPEIDGALVGGASLDPEEFALIVKYR